MSKWDALAEQLSFRIKNLRYFKQAFTHASYRNEHRGELIQDNERLEFLGDAVLELIVSEYLYDKFPQLPEGELTRMRAAIVCEPSLVTFARKLHFDTYIRLGKGEEISGGRQRPALLADVFEAFIGALYLDQGLEAVRSFLHRHVFSDLEQSHGLLLTDYKTMLQEHVQSTGMGSLSYKILEETGPAHNRQFVSQVLIDTRSMGIGSGRSKKEAEQRAARQTLEMLNVIS